jgi:hypothetical protein
MVRALQAEPGAPAHFGVPAADPVKPGKGGAAAKTFLLPRQRCPSDPFAYAIPVAW